MGTWVHRREASCDAVRFGRAALLAHHSSGSAAPTTLLPEGHSQLGLLQENHMYKKDSDTYDIYLLPPGEDVETCTSWLRMRNRDGRYNLMFEEWVTDGPFIISPRITFEVGHAATAA